MDRFRSPAESFGSPPLAGQLDESEAGRESERKAGESAL